LVRIAVDSGALRLRGRAWWRERRGGFRADLTRLCGVRDARTSGSKSSKIAWSCSSHDSKPTCSSSTPPNTSPENDADRGTRGTVRSRWSCHLVTWVSWAATG